MTEMQTLQSTRRIQAIDLVRGIIMIIMALDHTRDFFHALGFNSDPLNENSTTPALYATRWVTHFCAPTFVFLSGLSAWLQGRRKSTKELSLFLITRGLWLIIVDLIIMSFAFTANIHYQFLVLETLWSIGMGLVILGIMIWLPFIVILLTGILIVFGHNLLDFYEQSKEFQPSLWYSLLHQQRLEPLDSEHSLLVLYPFLSWAGLTMLGYCCGKLYTDMDIARRNKLLRIIGVSAIILFFVLRYINEYGDPRPWKTQSTDLKTVYVFMNVQKYPPSLLFTLATIGPVLILLSLVEKARGWLVRAVSVIGRVPLFYFVVHFYLLHLAQIITYLARGHSFREGWNIPGPFKFIDPGVGYNLPIVYLIWITLVILMYPLCYRYDKYKTAHKEKKWLSYL